MATKRASRPRVLVATDGSRDAQAAIATTMHFPWPAQTRVRVISARRTGAEYRRSILLTALDRGAEKAAESAQRTLSRRWPDIEIEVVDKSPVEGILDEPERLRADVIVVGWRGHGAVRRLLMGSVSRAVVPRLSKCADLVVRRSQRVRKIVVGIDGSPASKRARICRSACAATRWARQTCQRRRVDEGSSRGRVPGAAAIAREIRRTNTMRARMATKQLNRAAAELKRSGWQTRTVLVHGEPLRDLLAAVATARAQALVVGARGSSGLRHLLLGSVAEGAINRCPVAVLVAR